MQESLAEDMEGVEVSNLETPLMTDQERRILDAYDRLEELQLEIALLKAQGVISQDGLEPVEISEEDLETAQQELLKAKALYQVRSNIVESTLVANPVLKAVHAGSNATIIEQDLLPLIQQRDAFSVSLTALSSKVLSTRNELMKAESERIVLARKNAEFATKMMALAEEENTWNKENIKDPDLRRQLDELEAAMKDSRQRWRIMKGTASATIAGSGVDWARHPKLLEIVLDDEGK